MPVRLPYKTWATVAGGESFDSRVGEASSGMPGRQPDRQWTAAAFRTAWNITQWRAGIPTAIHVPAVVAFPEAVALAEILSNLN